MRKILIHLKKGILYCHAEEEVPNMVDFREWVFNNNYSGISIKGQDHLCYRSRVVKEYLQSKGFQCVEIVEDYGEREIKRQVHGLSNLEIMD